MKSEGTALAPAPEQRAAVLARGSGLPGVTTARLLDAIMDGYESAFEHDDEAADSVDPPKTVQIVMKKDLNRTWSHLAKDRITVHP